MARITYFVLAAAAAYAAHTAATTPPPAPTKEALVALEKSAYQAWKSKDTKFWDTFFSDKFVGYGSSGRLDRASAIREYAGAGCEIKSYAFSDEQVKPLGSDAALLTFKATLDGACGGQKIPTENRAAAVFVREGDKWKSAFYGDVPIVDPRAAAANPNSQEASRKVEAKPSARDAGTVAMLAVEQAVWEAWRVHDAKTLGDLTASDISFINIFGAHFPTKADALKDWGATGCDVKSVSVTGAAGTMLSPTVGILTFTGAADGTCYGQAIGPIWGTSVYVKDGDAWRWTFGMNVPAGVTGEPQAHEHLGEVACIDIPAGEKRPEFGCFNVGTVKELHFSEATVYWHLRLFESRKAAEAARSATGIVVEEDGRVWLSEFGARDAAPRGGKAVAVIGPLQLPVAKSYSAVLSYAVMRPGDSSRVHTHPGPEGWYVIAGEQCLETPAGANKAGAGKTMTVLPNVPMELNVTGTALRRAFALVIHDSTQPRGIQSDWKPAGKCGS